MIGVIVKVPLDYRYMTYCVSCEHVNPFVRRRCELCNKLIRRNTRNNKNKKVNNEKHSLWRNNHD